MTQNLTSTSPSPEKFDATKPDYDKQSPSEIRADIDQTRASVGDKIDQLQARLDPNRLKQQAQETVQEMLNDTASSMTDYVKTHRDEMVTSLADAARRNPLPTALIGLGVGWLILESMAGPRSERRSSSQETRYYPTSDWRPPEGNGGYNAGSSNRYAGAESYNPTTGQDFSRGYGQQGFSQGYNQSAGQSYGQNYGQSSGQNYGQNYSGSSSSYSPAYDQRYRQESGMSSGSSQQGESPIAKVTNVVKDTVGGTVNDMGQRAGDVVGDLKERAGDVVGDLKERVGSTMQDMGSYISDTAGDMRERLGDTVGDMRQQGMRQFDRASNHMDEWQNQARYQGQRRSRQMVNHLEDNPLIYGAVALAAGAALALLLPQSRVENRFLGEMRDEVMDRGQEMLGTARDHAQQVFEEVRPDLEQTARQIVSDVTETGKQAVRNAADQLSPVVDKAMSVSKDEARSAAKEIGVDPDKLTGNMQSSGNQMSGGQSSGSQSSGSQSSGSQMSGNQSSGMQSGGSQSSGTRSSTSQGSQSQMPVLNRDTLSGQWKQVKGEVKRKWGQLTDDDMTRIEGDYDKLVGTLQTRYGYTREHVERELNDFFRSQTA